MCVCAFVCHFCFGGLFGVGLEFNLGHRVRGLRRSVFLFFLFWFGWV